MQARQKVVGGARLFIRPLADGSGKIELFHERELEGVFTNEGEALEYAKEAIAPAYRVGSARIHPVRPKKRISAARRTG